MSKKWFLNSALILAASLTLVACGGKKEETATSSSSAASSSAVATADKLVDGTYTAEGENYDERGWKITHTITVKDGKITESKFDYINADGKLKTEDASYNENMKSKAGVSVAEAVEKLNTALVANQGKEAVEVVSGATNTTEDFKKTSESLLAAAQEGLTGTVVVK